MLERALASRLLNQRSNSYIMKRLILNLTFVILTGPVMAQVGIHRVENGSGQPNATGIENADQWEQDIYHAPQYMPGYPTAATLWPHIIDVPCANTAGKIICNGYNWTPDMGRTEYLLIRPVISEPVKPIVVTNTVTIIKEVKIPVPVPVFVPMTEKKIKE